MSFDEEEIQDVIVDLQDALRGRRTLEEAAERLRRRWSVESHALIDEAYRRLKRLAEQNRRLEIPPGLNASYNLDEERQANWYTGPADGDRMWPPLRAMLHAKFSEEDFRALDASSTKVVANLADPHVIGLKKRGLVLGYVQSGKTANYTAAIAKGADAGYRFVIVLAGMYNNLRKQTQRRLLSDLNVADWVQLTDEDRDFGRPLSDTALMGNATTRILAVVKKNSSRLRNLRDWLRAIAEEVRETCPILLLDDEADQATPNSQAARDEVSAINGLLKEIWGLIPSGSYVGYTATPFANIFMNPDDEDDLYPADFVIDLPRPTAYFGAERLFGRRSPVDADADEDDGLDVVRVVPPEDSALLDPRPVSEYEAELPDSLTDAIEWFLLATAVRRARGQDDHSSMLIHTTHYVEPHFLLQGSVAEHVALLHELVDSGSFDSLIRLWEAEKDRAASVRTQPLPPWNEVVAQLGGVLEDCQVIVDNGRSEVRLDYGQFNLDGTERKHTVIAIGGGTLSRGLTLEGLVVSYFNRTSNTYDTLLQMGRWFGYRPGYEDLQRIWATEQLHADFQFLSMVEEELRQEIRTLEQQRKTPRELGLRIRAHPGRLEITARAKMYFASEVNLDFSGTRAQTFILHETNRVALEGNLAAAKRLLAAALTHSGFPEQGLGATRHLWRGLPTQDVLDFIRSYAIHPDQQSLQSDVVSGWLERWAMNCQWNVGVVTGGRRATGEELVDLGLGAPVAMVSRAPLRNSEVGTANIKALRSAIDQVADLPVALVDEVSAESYPLLRKENAGMKGLLLLYPINPRSVPRATRTNTRRPMEAPLPLIGYSIAFPWVRTPDEGGGAAYWAVTPRWEVDALDPEDESLPEDREADLDAPVGGDVD